MMADWPGVSEVGAPLRVALGTSLQVIPLTVSGPLLVKVAVKVTLKFWLAWLKVLTQTPGVPALPFTMLLDGLVEPLPSALLFRCTGVWLVAPLPLHVMVSVALAPAWL